MKGIIMNPLISIIIPVYNADYSLLVSCLRSVINQTYSNIEVLIIDDGSKDEYRRKYDELKSFDERIKVVHQENQGVSRARNNGTKIAEGDFILYVDGDDVLAPIAVEEGVERIIKDNVDLVIAGVEKITEHIQFINQQTKVKKYEIYTIHDFDELRRHYISLDNIKYKSILGKGYINRGPYCRLIKREMALENMFPEGLPIGEDLIWNMNLLDKCKKVCVVYNIWYGYLINGTSAIRKYYGNRIQKVEEYLNKLYADHSDFCQSNIAIFGKNVAVEFYCVLRYELLSNKCNKTNKEKRQIVKSLLKREPWSIMEEKCVKTSLPRKYKCLILLCKLNLWQFAISLIR